MFGDKRPLSARMRRTERARQRERLAFRYIGALERGDFEIAAAVLRIAEGDPELEWMLRDVDAAYTAELDHTTSTQEHKNMIAMNDKRMLKKERGAGLRLTPLWFAAAAALIFAFAAVWMSGRGLLPGGDNGSPNRVGAPSGANAQAATATPVPTATPSIPLDVTLDTWSMTEGTFVPYTQFGDVTMAQPGTYVIDSSLSGLCVQSRASMDIRSRPAADAAIVSQIAAETEFRVQSYMLDESEALWLNIAVTIETASIQGWISADNEFRFVVCTEGMVTFGMFEMVAPLSPELLPTVVPPEGVGDFAQTATAIIAGATATANAATATPVGS
ncbi:MAG: hypothetical protein SGI73_16640 [Chloroflexota bacterium]|nr:hypothetical protein [Chloroflexota bacterium]